MTCFVHNAVQIIAEHVTLPAHRVYEGGALETRDYKAPKLPVRQPIEDRVTENNDKIGKVLNRGK